MTLEKILRESADRHKHLCPRQVLGARMSFFASELLHLDLPREDKRLLVTSETDGCAVDGIIAATHSRAGSRTLRILDFGKVAATFTDTHTETSLRIVPLREARSLAYEYAPQARNHWEAMLNGYQVMPLKNLFGVQSVQLNLPLSEIISRPGKKAVCELCGEEVINGREVILNDAVFCRACSGETYYHFANATLTIELFDHNKTS